MTDAEPTSLRTRLGTRSNVERPLGRGGRGAMYARVASLEARRRVASG